MKFQTTILLTALLTAGGVAHATAATVSFDSVVFTGTGDPVSVTGSDGTVFTFDAGSRAQFESFHSGFVGSFPLGSSVLAEGLGDSDPITITFSQPIFSIALPVASDRAGDSPYTTTVQFFDGATLVDSITQMGNTMNPAEVFSYNGAITSAVVSTAVAAADAPFGYTQHIGAFSYNVSSVPLPASAPMFGAALVAVGAAGYGLRRRKAAA